MHSWTPYWKVLVFTFINFMCSLTILIRSTAYILLCHLVNTFRYHSLGLSLFILWFFLDCQILQILPFFLNAQIILSLFSFLLYLQICTQPVIHTLITEVPGSDSSLKTAFCEYSRQSLKNGFWFTESTMSTIKEAVLSKCIVPPQQDPSSTALMFSVYEFLLGGMFPTTWIIPEEGLMWKISYLSNRAEKKTDVK